MTIGSSFLIVILAAIVNNAASQGYGRPPIIGMDGGGENFGFGGGEYPRHGHGDGYGYGGGYQTGHYGRGLYGNSDTYGLVGSYMNRDYRHGGYPQHYGEYSNIPYGNTGQYNSGGGYNIDPSQRYAGGGNEYATPERYAGSDQQRYASNGQLGQFGSGYQSSDSMPPISHNSDSLATSFSADVAPSQTPGQSDPIGSADKNSNPLPPPAEVPAAVDSADKTKTGEVQTLSPVKDGLDSTATIPGSLDNGVARGVQTLAPVNDGVIRESMPDSSSVPQRPSERTAETEEQPPASPTDGLSISPAHNSGS